MPQAFLEKSDLLSCDHCWRSFARVARIASREYRNDSRPTCSCKVLLKNSTVGVRGCSIGSDSLDAQTRKLLQILQPAPSSSKKRLHHTDGLRDELPSVHRKSAQLQRGEKRPWSLSRGVTKLWNCKDILPR